MATRTIERGSPAPRAVPDDEFIEGLKLIFKWRKQAKKLYQRIDAATDKLIALLDESDWEKTEWELGPNRFGKVVDNFIQKNKCFRAHGISRFEFVEDNR